MTSPAHKPGREVNRKIFSGIMMLTVVFLILAVFFFLFTWGLLELGGYFRQ